MMYWIFCVTIHNKKVSFLQAKSSLKELIHPNRGNFLIMFLSIMDETVEEDLSYSSLMNTDSKSKWGWVLGEIIKQNFLHAKTYFCLPKRRVAHRYIFLQILYSP